MSTTVSKSAFKARALEYLRHVETSGDPVIITDRGKPVVELRRLARSKEDPREALKGSILFYDRPMDPVGEEDWEIFNDPE